MITSQLGLSFKYYGNRKNDLIYTPSVVTPKSRNLFSPPNEKLILKERIKNKVKEEEYGYQIDMGEETVGFLDIDIDSCGENNIKFAYGQFLNKGRVKSHINSMDFIVEYVTHNDRNVYINLFRRLSGRYLEILCKNPIKINYMGIRTVVYQLEAKRPKFLSDLRKKIYNTSVKTLISCMHEHYEDTPWRKQALYTMDSRNEMLCTYKAFNDYKFARSKLVLISKGLRKDGMLSICYPAGRDFPIPSFSLAYILELYEYVFNSKDYTILDETFEVARKLILSFIERIDESGLISNFSYPFWNFYEWSPGNDNGEQIPRKPMIFIRNKEI